MLPKIMGTAVFSVGFFMLLLGVVDLIGVGLNYDFGRRVLIYVGGVLLCLMGYFMARRLPRTSVPPGGIVQTTTTEVQDTGPVDHF